MPYQNPYVPPPRHFAPRAGGNKATVAIIFTLILAVATNIYSFVYSNYIQNNIGRLFDFGYYNSFLNPPDTFNNDPFYGEGEPWGGNAPWNDDEFWNDIPGLDWDAEGQMTDDEMEAIDLVRESVLEGFPDFTIEEVLLSKVEEDGLGWDCFSDEGGEMPAYYVCAMGRAIGDFVVVYAGFYVYDDGSLELFNLDDGNKRDEFNEEAIELYGEWYEEMLSGFDTAAA